jgi:hypothetical protein
MKVNIVIYSEELAREDIRVLLQAIRDCEQKHFKGKEVGIALFAPALSKEQCQELIAGIEPGFPHIQAFTGGAI